MKLYTLDEATKASIAFFNGDVFAADAFVSKYALRTPTGEFLEATPADIVPRVCRELARVEQAYPNPMSEEEILDLLCTRDATTRQITEFGDVIPQGSPLSAIGNTFQKQSLSNCFVVASPYDSYSGIMMTDEQLAQIMKRRGGVGVDISPIRPKDMPTTNAARTTDGIGIFMQRFSNTCGEVAQGGRRGALMIMLSCLHPEIETFINIKKDKQLVTNANISIKWTDEFMQAVRDNTQITLRWPVDATPENAVVTKVVNAADIFEQFIQANWVADEPGGLFWDTVIKMSPADCYADVGYKTTATNPCVVGSTLIATADGRNAVTIRQLVCEGKDVPLYAVDPTTQRVEIRMGRNPRQTGTKCEVWKLTLDDGSTLIATPDHRVMLRCGTYVELAALLPGDSLMPFNSFNSNGYRQICNSGADMIGGAKLIVDNIV